MAEPKVQITNRALLMSLETLIENDMLLLLSMAAKLEGAHEATMIQGAYPGRWDIVLEVAARCRRATERHKATLALFRLALQNGSDEP